MTLTKAQLYTILVNHEIDNIPKDDIKIIIELFFEEIKSSLEKSENVKLSGFGKFNVKHKKSRPGRNPRTKKEVIISARKIVTFKASQKLKNTIISKYKAK